MYNAETYKYRTEKPNNNVNIYISVFKQFGMHTAVVKNILLGNSRILSEIVGLHIGKKLFHCTLHPHVNRKRFNSVKSEQKRAVGNLYSHSRNFHKLGSCLVIIAVSAFFKVDLSRRYLLCRINKIAVAEPCTQRRKVVRRKTSHIFSCGKSISAVDFSPKFSHSR